jgi:Lysozyme like domain
VALTLIPGGQRLPVSAPLAEFTPASAGAAGAPDAYRQAISASAHSAVVAAYQRHRAEARARARRAALAVPAAVPVAASVEPGILGCPGLEALWEAAGGSAGEAVTAADVAMAESGGNQYAVSPEGDIGYWQIASSWGPLASTDPTVNARAAVQISSGGSNWSAWSTYDDGEYASEGCG